MSIDNEQADWEEMEMADDDENDSSSHLDTPKKDNTEIFEIPAGGWSAGGHTDKSKDTDLDNDYSQKKGETEYISKPKISSTDIEITDEKK